MIDWVDNYTALDTAWVSADPEWFKKNANDTDLTAR